MATCVRAAEARMELSITLIRPVGSGRRFGRLAAVLALSLVSCADGASQRREPPAEASGGGTAGATLQSGTAGSTSQGGTAGSTSQGGTAGSTSQGGTAGSTSQGGAAGWTSQGGAAGWTSQGGTAGWTSQGGTAECPPDEVGQSCFLCQDHWFCGGDLNIDPTPAVDGCYLNGLPGRNLLWPDGTITADGVVVGMAMGAGVRLRVGYPDGSQWLFCARAP
jgi:hypothetical protein